jgi:hypothetical protein
MANPITIGKIILQTVNAPIPIAIVVIVTAGHYASFRLWARVEDLQALEVCSITMTRNALANRVILSPLLDIQFRMRWLHILQIASPTP